MKKFSFRRLLASRAFATRAAASGSLAMGAAAVGALAVGAAAVGALAIGAVTIRRLRALESKFDRVHIEHLTIGEMEIRRTIQPEGSKPLP